MTKKVLIYSPYGTWHFHSMYEITIGHGLKVRGSEVKHICCDACYSDCDVNWDATSPRTEQSCKACMHYSQSMFNDMQMPFDWFSTYLSEEIIQNAKIWADTLADEALFTASFKNYPLGEWVRSSVHSHFRMNKLDINNKRINQVYRSYLYGAYIALHGFENLLDGFNPDAIVMLNGRFFSHRVLYELAQLRGIRVLVHERGARVGTLRLWENENCHSYQTSYRLWQQWKYVPLSQDQIEQINCILNERENGINTGWRPVTSPKQNLTEICKRLCIPSGKKVISLFTSSDDEMVASEGWETVMDQLDWIDRSIKYFSKHSEYILVIRIHPNTKGIMGANEQFLNKLEFILNQHNPENLRVIAPEEKINSYELMDIADKCLVLSSTVSLEAVVRGKPVMMSGGGQLFGHEYSTNLTNENQYEEILTDFLNKEITETAIMYALRYAYHLFIRMSLPFPLVKCEDVALASNNYKTLDDLLPGRDEALDRVCNYILDGDSIYSFPALSNQADQSAEIREVKNRLTQISERPIINSITELVTTEQHYSKKISVVITCFNYGQYLAEAVGSVLIQDFDNYEIIIVNDGSTDNSLEVAKNIKDSNTSTSIKIIDQENSGQPAISRNNGIKEAQGEYILCLDADDMILPSMLSECLKLLETNKRVDIAYTDRQDFDGVDEVVMAGEYNFDILRYQNHISYCALYRKSVWEDVGGYRTNIRGCEDWDFWVAAGVRGHYGMRIPKAYFMYRRHDTGLYQEALQNFDKKIAQIILNNQSVYPSADIEKAKLILNPVHCEDSENADITKGLADEGINKYQQFDNNILSAGNDNILGKNPLVSVIIPTYKRPMTLINSLNSLQNQSYQNWEAIVVDDDNGSAEAAITTFSDDKRIHYIRHSENKGQSAARNTGLGRVTGKIICFLDDDDIYYPDHLETLVDGLMNFDGAVVYTDSIRAEKENISEGTKYSLTDNPFAHEDYSIKLLYAGNYIPINTIAFLSVLVEYIGGFDEELPSLEDWDLLLRLANISKFKHINKTTAEIRLDSNDNENISNKGLNNYPIVYREIYDRYDDMDDELIKSQRIATLKVIDNLSQNIAC